MGNALKFLFYSLGAGLLLAGFVVVPGVLRYAFSLGALFVGMRYFRDHERKGARIGFVVLTLVFGLILPSVYVMIAIANGWQVDPRYTESLTGS